jgi:hypothetical protein
MTHTDPACRYLVRVVLASGEEELIPYPTRAEAAFVVALLERVADGSTTLPKPEAPFVYLFPPSDAVVAVELRESNDAAP